MLFPIKIIFLGICARGLILYMSEYCGKGSRSGVGSNGGNGYVSGDNKIVIFIDPNDIMQESNEDNNEEAYVLIRLSTTTSCYRT